MKNTDRNYEGSDGMYDGLRRDAVRVGVSSCLLGNSVRFDGGHKRSRFITDELAQHFEFVRYCPELAIGMGVPRQPIRLTGDAGNPQVVGVKNPEFNVTQPLQDYSKKAALQMQGLDGFIFKKDSPSCGMARVKVYNEAGMPERAGTGVFAHAVMTGNPLLPVEEEGRLNDPDLRDNFVMRVYVHARWRRLLAGTVTASRLLDFHTSHKYLLLAHSEVAYRALGALLADLSTGSTAEIADRYIKQLMQALSKPASRKRHSNVLLHLLGYLKRSLDAPLRRDLASTIDAYRNGIYPLVVPVRLLQHQFSAHPNPYVSKQVYLDPHPADLKLRNLV